MIKELVKNEKFISSTKLTSTRIKKMEDEELVLRYFALSYKDGYKDYKGSIKNFLTDKMTAFNELNTKELKELKNNFLYSFKILERSNIELPFAKFRSENGHLEKMSDFNVSVYDSMIVLLSKMDKDTILNINDFRKLFHDSEYFKTLEGSTTDSLKVQKRIDMAIKVLL